MSRHPTCQLSRVRARSPHPCAGALQHSAAACFPVPASLPPDPRVEPSAWRSRCCKAYGSPPLPLLLAAVLGALHPSPPRPEGGRWQPASPRRCPTAQRQGDGHPAPLPHSCCSKARVAARALAHSSASHPHSLSTCPPPKANAVVILQGPPWPRQRREKALKAEQCTRDGRQTGREQEWRSQGAPAGACSSAPPRGGWAGWLNRGGEKRTAAQKMAPAACALHPARAHVRAHRRWEGISNHWTGWAEPRLARRRKEISIL